MSCDEEEEAPDAVTDSGATVKVKPDKIRNLGWTRWRLDQRPQKQSQRLGQGPQADSKIDVRCATLWGTVKISFK